jgi:hypothetical protein
MDSEDQRIADVVNNTRIIRQPKSRLATFGTTNIRYWVLTVPVYAEDSEKGDETVVREGKVIAEQPRIVTPYYLSNLDGFGSGARRYFNMLEDEQTATAGIFYTYRNELHETNVVTDNLVSVAEKIGGIIDESGDPLTTIISGEDDLWDVSLMKFIYEITRRSVMSNMRQMNRRGLLNVDESGLPMEARLRIDELFRQVIRGEREAGDLKMELDRWNVFEEYEDRFLGIFRKGR